MRSTKEKLEKLVGLELKVTFDTREDTGCEDEEFGHFIECQVVQLEKYQIRLKNIKNIKILSWPNPIPNNEPPIIVFYENELVQFFHDALPYPVAANTAQEAREMSMFLNPAPVHIDQITEDDFTNFINSLIDEYEEEE